MKSQMFLTRNRALLFAALVLGCTGCDVASTTLLPRVVDNRLVGEWRGPDELGKGNTKTKLWHVHLSGDSYELGTAEEFQKKDTAHFSLAKIGALFLIQEVSDNPENYSACGKFTDSSPSCRCLLGVVEISQDRCVFRMFNTSKMVLDSFTTALPIAYAAHAERNAAGKLEAHILFRADAVPLAQFLGSYVASHPASFQRADTFTRVH